MQGGTNNFKSGGSKTTVRSNVTINQTNVTVIGGYGSPFAYRPMYMAPMWYVQRRANVFPLLRVASLTSIASRAGV